MKTVSQAGTAFGHFLGSVKNHVARIAESGLNEHLLHTLIGVLGLLLPMVVVVWGLFITGWPPLTSISAYYTLRTRDAFVGILFVIGWILFAYQGYNKKIDPVFGKLAWLCAMGVALFPCQGGADWEGKLHIICAACLFIILGVFSLFLFTMNSQSSQKIKDILTTNPFRANKIISNLSNDKKKRNSTFYICGSIIFSCMLTLAILKIVHVEGHWVLILETVMIWSFAFAWFVKGRSLFWKAD